MIITSILQLGGDVIRLDPPKGPADLGLSLPIHWWQSGQGYSESLP